MRGWRQPNRLLVGTEYTLSILPSHRIRYSELASVVLRPWEPASELAAPTDKLSARPTGTQHGGGSRRVRGVAAPPGFPRHGCVSASPKSGPRFWGPLAA